MTDAPVTSPLERIEAHLLELLEPLRGELEQLDARLSVVNAEREGLLATRRRIESTIRTITGEAPAKPGPKVGSTNSKANPGVARGNAARAQAQQQAKTDAVAAYLEAHPDEFADGFTANSLADKLTSVVPRGLTVKSARKTIEALRDRGVLRADKVVRGGGMQFQIVNSTNGSSDG